MVRPSIRNLIIRIRMNPSITNRIFDSMDICKRGEYGMIVRMPCLIGNCSEFLIKEIHFVDTFFIRVIFYFVNYLHRNETWDGALRTM